MEFLGFLACALVIFYSGKKLSVYGDQIASYLGLGKAWIGLIMMASVTSLPELVVGISSVTIPQSADLAVGDVLGSCAFNLLILSLLDAFYRKSPIFSKATQGHMLTGNLSVILLAFVGIGIFLPGKDIILGWIGLISLICMVIYFISVRIIYQYEVKRARVKEALEEKREQVSAVDFKNAVRFYFLHAVVVIGSAIFLPYFAEGIALHTGLEQSFVGTLFLAASTSFPEVAVAFSAMRLGFVDMAVGNLLGSNIFNILILAIDDMFYTKGYLLKDASEIHLISVFSVIVMTSIAVVGLLYGKTTKRYLMTWDTLLILVIYFINLLLLYISGVE